MTGPPAHPERSPAMTPLLTVEGLQVCQVRRRAPNLVVDRVDLSVAQGRTLGIVGESGCGKSATALAIARLLPKGELAVVGGRVCFEGRDLIGISERELRHVRGRDIGIVFQDPMTALNPVLRIETQLAEVLHAHNRIDGRAASQRCEELLDEVRMPRAREILKSYPHELSGGMRQRVVIATAIACGPKLLIADEPTTALDVTVQADILDLLRQLTRERSMALMIITHDIGVLASIADETIVMYAGEVVEFGATTSILDEPEHPYTELLIAARPDIHAAGVRTDPLRTIPGAPPTPSEMPTGCRFALRCPFQDRDSCHHTHSELHEVRLGHWVRSLHPRSFRRGVDSERRREH